MTTELTKAAQQALEALEEIALAGMSGTGQESEEGMRDWHARQAWKFIGIAARALDPLKSALTQRPAAQTEREAVDAAIADEFEPGHWTLSAQRAIRENPSAVLGMLAQLKRLQAAQQATPEPVLPFLVRDVAALLGATVLDVCKALTQLGHGQRSTNMAIAPHEALEVAAHIRPATPEPVGEPLGYIPTDAIDQIKTPPRLITRNVPVLSYAADGYTAIYTRPAPGVPADVQRNAARWEEVLRQVGADRQCGGFRFTLHNLRPIPGSNPMQGAVCQHFTQAVDAMLAAAAQAKSSPTKDQPTAEKGNHD